MTTVCAPPRPSTSDQSPADGLPLPSGQRIRPVAARSRSGRRWRSPRIGAGQVVTTQVAAAGLVAVAGRGLPAIAGTALAALGLLVVTWFRVRRRWLYEWLAIGFGYLARRRARRSLSTAAELLDLVAPHAVVRTVEWEGGPASVLDDPDGLVALLEVGDPAELLGDGGQRVGSPASLLADETDQAPPVRVQLLLTGTPTPAVAAGDGAAAASYRQLGDQRLAGWERTVLAVRVSRARGWPEETLGNALAGVVRRIARRLRPVSVRPLGEQSVRRVLAEFAHHDGRPVRESWQTVRCGGLLQTSFRLSGWPVGEAMFPRLWGLPATAITVSLHSATGRPTAGSGRAGPSAGLVVRLAAATPAELANAARQFRRTVALVGATVERLDGRQVTGFADTLPLALPTASPPTSAGHPELTVPYGNAGLQLGVNRHGHAVTVRLFRPESTRLVLGGGVPVAQLVAVRALALGAQVVVQTTRPHAWDRFLRGVGVPGAPVRLAPPDRPVTRGSGTPLAPVLVVLDAPPPPGPRPGTAWQTTLLVRDALTPSDTDPLGRADLAVLPPLSQAEATVAGAALGLGDAAHLLTRIRPGMVAVVNRRALRWALLVPTPIEAQLIGADIHRHAG
ncbi:type VII secretion protein EccE [Micromonospora sp. CP22]|nr:type VII secretion protein EccE [Micromonospora sp. CP22]